MENQPNNPLHGVKLADILSELVDNYGWEHMAFKVNINGETRELDVPGEMPLLWALRGELDPHTRAINLDALDDRGVGGDAVKGVRFADLLAPFNADARTHAIALIGEVGGAEEEEFAAVLAGGSLVNFPSITWPSHTAIVTGAWCGHHDVVNPTYYLRDRRETISPQGLQINTERFASSAVESLHEAFHRRDPEAFTVAIHAPFGRSAKHAVLESRNLCDRARVKELTNGQGVPVVYDSIGADTFTKSLDCLSPLGTMVSFGSASGPVPPFSLQELASRGSLFITRPTLFAYTAKRSDLEAMAADLFGMVSSGKVKIEINQRYALKDVQQAHRDLESRKTTGSTILLP